ncbi:hypothetical protein CC80DRAFT_292756 [Byssothecium circinans]|uniref:Uncharacterized protein n=1 Tax=Byssothecium circinans TaxID=147558 RepID=A0A6A5U6R4_9PLEO|nr:hypothetical protein CC80DRAFT_292756 [Byssothecium circinans]
MAARMPLHCFRSTLCSLTVGQGPPTHQVHLYTLAFNLLLLCPSLRNDAMRWPHPGLSPHDRGLSGASCLLDNTAYNRAHAQPSYASKELDRASLLQEMIPELQARLQSHRMTFRSFHYAGYYGGEVTMEM